MKNKGFIFVETIVVIVILTVGLIMVYFSFSSVLNNDKRRAAYNDAAYIYRTFYIEDFITSLNIEDYIENFLDNNNKKIVGFDCNSAQLYKIDSNVQSNSVGIPPSEEVKRDFCSSLLNSFNVSNVYITKYNVTELKQCTTIGGKALSSCKKSNLALYDALNSLDSSMIYYLRTLTGKDNNNYRLIVEFNDNTIDNDNTISKIKTESGFKCPDGYTDVAGNNNVCSRQIKKNYFANIKVVLKSQLRQ